MFGWKNRAVTWLWTYPPSQVPGEGEELVIWVPNCVLLIFHKTVKIQFKYYPLTDPFKEWLFKLTPSKDKFIQGLLVTPNCGFSDFHQHLDTIPKHGKTMKNENLSQIISFWRRIRRKSIASHLHKHKQTCKKNIQEYVSVLLRWEKSDFRPGI